MAYRGAYEDDVANGYYTGPGPLESLVASFLDQSIGQAQARRKRALEDAKARRDEADATSIRQERAANMAEHGFLPASAVDPASTVPIPVPGPGGNIVAQGGVRRYQPVGEGLVKDRLDNPDTARRQAQIDKDATEQRRRDRLSRAVGQALDPSLNPQQRASAIAAAIQEDPTQAPGMIRELTPDTPKAPPQPEWAAKGFPNEKDYLAFLRRKAVAERISGGGGGESRTLLNQQINDAQQEAARADRAIPTHRPDAAVDAVDPTTGRVLIPADSRSVQAFVIDSTAKAGEADLARAILTARRRQRGDFAGVELGTTNPTPVAGAVVNMRGQPAGQPAPSTDTQKRGAQKPDLAALRAGAASAIQRGADPAKVRARYRQLTGQDLP